ncbi:MAG: hypothetical protein AB7L66_10200 [Gemmatimonadales bacterium]
MTQAPSIGVPELAGLGSYAAAARPGFSVDDTVARLLRYQWLERTLVRVVAAHFAATPEWEVKCGLALLAWQCAEHVETFRQRIGEMRHPVPALDTPPDAEIERFGDELLHSHDTVELLAGIYDVVVPGLVATYRDHLDRGNLLVDHPTRRPLRFALLELEEALAWGGAAGAALSAGRPNPERRTARAEELGRFLTAAGGIAGEGPRTTRPPARSGIPYAPDFTPRRDGRFAGLHRFDFPPHLIYNHPAVPVAERNLALLAKRTLEMDVPEMMASVMFERTDLPWEFQRDYARQLWDETRHAMMGTVAFEARGIDWTTLPLNVGFSLRLNRHATALERQALLFAIEQSLMPGETGKRFEHRTAVEAGDELSAHFHDYDWADEVLHAQIGRRWLKRDGLSPEAASSLGAQVHERTWKELDRYRDEPEPEWWDGFVQQALGRPTALPPEARPELRIMAE